MMKNAWDKKRAENHVATYGAPDNPNPRYKRRMVFAAKQVTGSVLDVGCGVGYLYPLLRSKVSTYKGVDSSPYMIKIAKSHFPDGCFEVGDAYDLSKEDECDSVISMSLLIHIHKDDTEKVIKEMWSRTKQTLVFSMPIDRDVSKTVELSRKIRGASGVTLITHISDRRLEKILHTLNPKQIKKIPFRKGSFGFGLNDFLIKVTK
ncbi:hypothetical protein ES702_00382 [subsurface metagenome]